MQKEKYQKVSAPIFCPNCGAANDSQQTICIVCDQPLDELDDQFPVSPTTGNRIVKGRYRLLTRLGAGGSGAVYQAEDTILHNKVIAVKEISLHGLQATEAKEATDLFHQEAQLLAHLNHPNLPGIYDEFVEDESCFLVMDYIDGVNLETYVIQQPDGKLAIDEALDMALTICGVLHYLHSRQPPIIFRDLKPANVMRTEHGHLYLIDFGIARFFKPGQQKDTMPFGSPGYAAPEQYGRTQTTPRSDIYSLGALLHFQVTGHDASLEPFRFEPLPAHGVKNADALDLFLQQMLELKAERRPATITEVQTELKHLRTQFQIQIATPSRKQSSSNSKRNKKRSKKQNAAPDPISAVSAQQIQIQRPASKSKQKPASSRRSFLVGTAILGGIGLLVGGGFIINALDEGGSSRSDYTYIERAVWSPDGVHVALAFDAGDIQIIHATGNREVARFNHATDESSITSVHHMAWSPQGTQLAFSYYRSETFIWDLEQQSIVQTYRGHNSTYRSIFAWSPDSTMIASIANEEIHIWSVGGGSLLYNTQIPPPLHDNSYLDIAALSWSGDNEHIAVGIVTNYSEKDENDYEVQIYHISQPDAIKAHSFPQAKDAYSFYVAWSPTRPYIAVHYDSVLWLLNTEDAAQNQQLKNLFNDAEQLLWSPDGTILTFIASYDSIATWNLDSRTPAFYETSTSIKAFGWLPDGKQIRLIDSDKEITTLKLDRE